MENYAGLGVSLKEISICVVDRDGKTIARGACPADPEGVAGWFRNRSLMPRRIVHESGNLSIWLQRGMTRLGLARAGRQIPSWVSAQQLLTQAAW
ncbi:hypothetical protein [Rhodovulum sp. MB263]|uniref:hypothetical protein n=1 Tax=Rhodovulum sp. (strain MB263) TaxID=308754 RepID=UPI001E4DBB98|nr:hypothetical protein [Rhodovulum sp. MB263]